MPTRNSAVKGISAGLALGLAGYVVTEALRSRPGPARLVDWDEVRDRAKARLGPGDPITPRRRRALEDEYARLADGVKAPFFKLVGALPSGLLLPDFEALDRHGWVDLNAEILATAMEPILALQEKLPHNGMTDFGQTLVDRYAGLLLGFLGSRVLGQYDPQLLGREPAGEPGLYLVEPNIARWQEEANLDREPLRRWLILHEMTHAWQFAAHPWLRDHLNSMLQEVLGAAVGRSGDPLQSALRMAFGMGDQVAVLARVQATMSLIEGYSNLVMDVVGRQVIPEFEELEAAFEERAAQKSLFERAFWKITGLELKLQQYVIGEQFSRVIYEARGIKALNRAWESADTLPTMRELKEPELWITRVLGPRSRRRTSQTSVAE